MNFLALFPAPLVLDGEIAGTPAATSEPASSPTAVWMLNRNPVTSGALCQQHRDNQLTI